jgi:ABC-2 type transport system ATP-binding protein
MKAIKISNLQKAYGSALVLKDVNLEVDSGEIIGYIGPNGAGKSTTIKILIGMIPDYAGSVEVMGFDVKTNPLEVKRLIGYVPENASLYDTLSPMEYLRFLGSLYQLETDQIEEKATELLRLFALYDQRDDRMTTFSKGMKQKVLLISGILHNPKVIFLDEPLSGLDANAVILVKEILSQLVILLTPYAPHFAEELWQVLGMDGLVVDAAYPVFDAQYVTETAKEYPISINGKLRANILIALDASEDQVRAIVLDNEVVKKWVEDKPIKKLIFVKGKMVNIVI